MQQRTVKGGETNTHAKFAAGIHHRAGKLAGKFRDVAGSLIAVICTSNSSFVVGSHGLAIAESTGKNGRVKEN